MLLPRRRSIAQRLLDQTGDLFKQFLLPSGFSSSADGLDRIGQLFLIFNGRRDQLRAGHGGRAIAFQYQDGMIGMHIDLIAGSNFLFGQNTMLDQDLRYSS